MNPSRAIVCVVVTLVVAACTAASPAASVGPSGPAVTTPTPAAEPSATPAMPRGSASFTSVQADRGRDSFRAKCTECHYSSEFSDSQFKFKWSRRTVGSLYHFIRTSMPETDPGSLSDVESVDLVSYIIRMNGFEPGATELAPDRSVLDAISLSTIRKD